MTSASCTCVWSQFTKGWHVTWLKEWITCHQNLILISQYELLVHLECYILIQTPPQSDIWLQGYGKFSKIPKQCMIRICHLSKGPFILRSNCVALQHCTLLHRNCNVAALWCGMKVISFQLEMRWCCGDLWQKLVDISTPQCNCGVVWMDITPVTHY